MNNKPSLFFRDRVKNTPYMFLTSANVATLAVYVDVEARVWVTPLVEFQDKFRRDTEMTDEYFAQLYQEAERRLEAQPKPTPIPEKEDKQNDSKT